MQWILKQKQPRQEGQQEVVEDLVNIECGMRITATLHGSMQIDGNGEDRFVEVQMGYRACGLKELLWNLDRFQGLGETCDSLASRAVELMLDLKENP